MKPVFLDWTKSGQVESCVKMHIQKILIHGAPSQTSWSKESLGMSLRNLLILLSFYPWDKVPPSSPRLSDDVQGGQRVRDGVYLAGHLAPWLIRSLYGVSLSKSSSLGQREEQAQYPLYTRLFSHMHGSVTPGFFHLIFCRQWGVKTPWPISCVSVSSFSVLDWLFCLAW